MNVDESIDTVVKVFKEKKPKTLAEVKALGFNPKFLGRGLYRSGYRIDGYPLIIKVPHKWEIGAVDHAQAEVSMIRLITRLKKYKKLAPFMPKLYYFDKKSGMLLMHHYKKVGKRCKKAITKLMRAVVDLTWNERSIDCDVHGDNVGLGADGPVIIDLGYFHESGRV